MSFKEIQKRLLLSLVLVSCLLFFGIEFAYSQQIDSTSYKVIDSVVGAGGYGASTNFKLFGVISQAANGLSNSLSFGNNAGFLSFPLVSTPAVSTTAGNSQVALSWTASVGYVGWTVGGYSIGQSTVSGGPYTYSSVGNVLSSTRTGLSNNTPYYFVIVVNDSLGNAIATSTQVSATPVAPSSGGGGGGGGGGGEGPSSSTGDSGSSGAVLSGRAYPKSSVILLKDSQIVATTIAGADAKFQINLTGLSSGNYVFSLYGEDKDGNRSSLTSFSILLTTGASVNIGGIFIEPSLSADKLEVKKGDNIAFFGQSSPKSDIIISVHSDQELFAKTKSDTDGAYLLNFDTSVLEMGSHAAKSKAAVAGEISSFGKSTQFTVGTKNVLANKTTAKFPAKGDINQDCRVNLIDFSIAAFWYKKPLNKVFVDNDKKYLNGDGRIDLVDFSIMAYYWTG